jgi:hypothetical protein
MILALGANDVLSISLGMVCSSPDRLSTFIYIIRSNSMKKEKPWDKKDNNIPN